MGEEPRSLGNAKRPKTDRPCNAIIVVVVVVVVVRKDTNVVPQVTESSGTGKSSCCQRVSAFLLARHATSFGNQHFFLSRFRGFLALG